MCAPLLVFFHVAVDMGGSDAGAAVLCLSAAQIPVTGKSRVLFWSSPDEDKLQQIIERTTLLREILIPFHSHYAGKPFNAFPLQKRVQLHSRRTMSLRTPMTLLMLLPSDSISSATITLFCN